MNKVLHNIYYLDDDESSVKRSLQSLKTYGPWTVEGHWLVQNALSAFKNKKYDLYLIDWMLRRKQADNLIDGDEVLANLLAMKTYDPSSP